MDTAQAAAAVGIRVQALDTAQAVGIRVQAQDGHQVVVATAPVAGHQAAVVVGTRSSKSHIQE